MGNQGSRMPITEPKIFDLVTSVESEVFQTEAGPMVWGAVDITYTCHGLEPRVSLRVPVPALESESDETRRSEALRRARQLIDHACIAMGPTREPPSAIGELLEGLSEELGLFPPTTQPGSSRQQKLFRPSEWREKRFAFTGAESPTVSEKKARC